jgi:hypothetical protein
MVKSYIIRTEKLMSLAKAMQAHFFRAYAYREVGLWVAVGRNSGG